MSGSQGAASSSESAAGLAPVLWRESVWTLMSLAV